MRAFIKQYLEAAKARREESNDKGFSLVELIVVIVVIGILIAVAFPIFGAVQKNAAVGALNSAAAEGATVAASEIALGNATAATILDAVNNSDTSDYALTLHSGFTSTTDLQDVCIVATAKPNGALVAAGTDTALATTETGLAGPGCP